MMALGIVAGVVVLLVALAWVFQRSLVFLPSGPTPPPAADVVAGAGDVEVETSDGLRLTMWHVPPSGGCAATVLVAPGNAGNRAGRAGLMRALAGEGFGVFLVEYRGFGGNPGSPSQAGLARDVRAARDAALELDDGHLLYLGESLGAAVVTELATEHPPDGLVLRSPFTSLAAAARANYHVPLGWLLRDEFPLVEQAAAVRGAAAVVLGTADSVVPPGQSRAVAQALRDAGADVTVAEVDGANHNDAVLTAGPTLVDAVVDVAARAGATGCG